MFAPQSADLRPAARQWRITGQVQGVGFRPHVYRQAHAAGLIGYVLNDSHGVLIHAQGTHQALDRFEHALHDHLPPIARIDSIHARTAKVDSTLVQFEIAPSHPDAATTALVTVDTAVCADCLAELFDPSDPRHRYGLINCTNCGPRYSILRAVPYDRPNTTMAGFALCTRCAAQYADPTDRRFHAQPTACPDCGPTVALVNSLGQSIPGDPYRQAAARLHAGQILAIKGLGGYHLALRADDQSAVSRLRRAKHRDAKPFALMCRDISTAQSLAHLSDQATASMLSPACPIVLAVRKANAPIAPSVAPDNHRLGLLLPYTPMQHLLFASLDLNVLVMTSANDHDEPLITDDADALRRLAPLCDAILRHDRPIARSVDDSVLLDTTRGLMPLRRARGYAPSVVKLPIASPSPGLCTGGELKNTIALVRGDQAILSPHIGNLAHPSAFALFEKTIADLCTLFDIAPQWVAHDLHPTYMSTQFALKYAAQNNVRSIGVQHHFAHAASLLAEHQRSVPTLIIAADGVGLGPDRSLWGGEILIADLTSYRRVASLAPLALPGGDAAARQTRRCALAALKLALGDDYAEHPLTRRLLSNSHDRNMLTAMLHHGVNCINSSAAGRWFDAVAAILDLCPINTFEAQAGLALEAAAFPHGLPDLRTPLFNMAPDALDPSLTRIDLAPLIRFLVQAVEQGQCTGELAAIFHAQLAWALSDAAQQAARNHNLDHVGLTGGVFANQLLSDALTTRLHNSNLTVLHHHRVPAGDGGLSFGQAAHAAAILEATPCA